MPSDSPPAAHAAPPPPTSSPPGLIALFVAFAKMSLSGFGGVLAWSRRMMVEERKWLTPEQFNEIYALCALLPGGNILNFAVMFGARLRGAASSISTAG